MAQIFRSTNFHTFAQVKVKTTTRHDMFISTDEVQVSATEWLWTYDIERPNIAKGRITPVQKLEQHMKHAA